MIELPDRIDMARSYADSTSTQVPFFWAYAEREIQTFCNGLPRRDDRDEGIAGTQAGRNLAAILRGELRWPS
jgi:hypothetical protein